MTYVTLETQRQGYTPDQCGSTMTVQEMIDCLSGFDPDAKIYFSNDNIVNLNNKFGEEYYNKIISLDNLENIKVGFNIKYSLSNGENINQTITNPSNTITNGYILNYLYN